MSPENIQAIVLVVIANTIAAVGAFIQARITNKAVNSRMTELLELVRKGAADEATLKEKAAEHLRKGEEAAAKAPEL